MRGAPEDLLDTYDEERLPVAAHVLGLTSRLHRAGFRPTTGAAPALNQLDLEYRSSSLSLDARAAKGALAAGDRAPDGRLADGRRLFEVFRGPHFTRLHFGYSPPVGQAAAHRHVREQTIDGAIPGYDVADGTTVVVRPDGYIGAIASGRGGLDDYLGRFA